MEGDADLDTLATALLVRTDDLLKAAPERAPWRPRVGMLARDTTLWTDDVWVVDSTRSSADDRERPRAALIWPAGPSPTGAKADERQTLLGILDADPELTNATTGRAGQIVIADKSYYGREFESRSTTPSRANSTSNSTAATPPPAPGSASSNASSL